VTSLGESECGSQPGWPRAQHKGVYSLSSHGFGEIETTAGSAQTPSSANWRTALARGRPSTACDVFLRCSGTQKAAFEELPESAHLIAPLKID
jgi:hypothetical protein